MTPDALTSSAVISTSDSATKLGRSRERGHFGGESGGIAIANLATYSRGPRRPMVETAAIVW